MTIAALMSVPDNSAGNSSEASAGASTVPSVGYFPTTLPRDPILVNNFYEHVLVGQIIEPLVESSATGAIMPSIAESWRVSNEGKEILFQLYKDIKFSDGTRLDAEDVKYSLERQKNSPVSQSKFYLSKIKSIDIVSEYQIRITLHEPYLVIFKALSRDHLGIVSKGWTFQANQNEPIVGTGPYRALRQSDGKWKLIKNEQYRFREQVQIPQWNVIQYDPIQPNYESLPLPDLVPFLTGDVVDRIQTQVDHSHVLKEKITHFTQFSAWWYPHGKSFYDEQTKKRAMNAVRVLIGMRQRDVVYRAATGVIPVGILGHLDDPIPVTILSALNQEHITIRMAATIREYELLNNSDNLNSVEKETGVKIILEKVPNPQLSELPKIRPDVLALSYAGGFHDPEGFLVVIGGMLSSSLEDIFGRYYADYLFAAHALDWQERDKLYQKFGRALVEHSILAPGWKWDVFSVRNPKIKLNASTLSYTPKLKHYTMMK